MSRRILYLHPHFTLPGGAGRYVLETGSELARRGWDVHVAAITITPSLVAGHDSISFHELGGALPSSLRYWCTLPLLLQRVSKLVRTLAPDILFSQVFPANWWGFHVKHRGGAKVQHIWMCQEPSAFIHSDRWTRALPKSPAGIAARVFNPILKPLDRHFATAVDYVFANSEFSRQLAFNAYGYDPQKVGLSYPGVDLNRFKLDPSITRIPHQFITCARLTKFKNVDRVLHAFSRLDAADATLLVIGDGEEYESLRALSEKLKLTKRVSFRRTVSDQEMVKALQSSAALVHAAEEEPFGLAPIEAMACGTPVIAIRGGGPAETVLHEQTGYLCGTAEVEELLPGMRWVLSIEQQHSTIAAACQARARHFTWTKAVDSLETVFGFAEEAQIPVVL